MRLFLLKETGNHIEQYQIVFDIVENCAKLSPTSRLYLFLLSRYGVQKPIFSMANVAAFVALAC